MYVYINFMSKLVLTQQNRVMDRTPIPEKSTVSYFVVVDDHFDDR